MIKTIGQPPAHIFVKENQRLGNGYNYKLMGKVGWIWKAWPGPKLRHVRA